jgi:flagellar biosynthesis protein FlhA
VTRSGSKEQLGTELADQVTSQPRGMLITAGFMVLLAVTPLPTVPLFVTAAGLAGMAVAMQAASRRAVAKAASEKTAGAPKAEPAPPIESLLKVDTLELEVGYGLVQLVDATQGGDLLERIAAVRRQLAVELGLVMPPVRIRDNMQLSSGEYRVKIRGNPVSQGFVRPGKLLAMDSGLVSGPIDGEKTREPAFGLDAWWIEPASRPRAETLNYTVVDPTSVLATHLTEIVKRHAEELLTRDEVNNLLEQVKQKSPKLLEEVVPGIVRAADLQKLLQGLLRERVPIRDLECVLETLADWGTKTKDLDVLTEYVRHALRRTICQQYATPDPETGRQKLLCVTLDPALEDQVNAYIDRGPAGTVVNMPSRLAAKIAEQVRLALQPVLARGAMPVVIASPQVRAVVRQIVEPHVAGVAVLGYNEVVGGLEVESLALATLPSDAMVAAEAA